MVDALTNNRDIFSEYQRTGADASRLLSDEGNAELARLSGVARVSEPLTGTLELTDPFTEAAGHSPISVRSDVTAQTTAEQSLSGKSANWVSGLADISEDVIKGAATSAYKEVTEHPVHTLVRLGEGAAIGLAVVSAAPVLSALGAGAAVVAGAEVASNVALMGMGAYGTVHTVHEVAHTVNKLSDSNSVLVHRNEHSANELDAARLNIETEAGPVAIDAAKSTFGAVTGVKTGVGFAAAAHT